MVSKEEAKKLDDLDKAEVEEYMPPGKLRKEILEKIDDGERDSE